jgi:hypothetical protein
MATNLSMGLSMKRCQNMPEVTAMTADRTAEYAQDRPDWVERPTLNQLRRDSSCCRSAHLNGNGQVRVRRAAGAGIVGSLLTNRVRQVDEASDVAQHCEHLESLARTRIRPPRVRNQVAHAHERAADQRGGAFVG